MIEAFEHKDPLKDLVIQLIRQHIHRNGDGAKTVAILLSKFVRRSFSQFGRDKSTPDSRRESAEKLKILRQITLFEANVLPGVFERLKLRAKNVMGR